MAPVYSWYQNDEKPSPEVTMEPNTQGKNPRHRSAILLGSAHRYNVFIWATFRKLTPLRVFFLLSRKIADDVDSRDLKQPRRRRQRERQKTIVLFNKTLALHVG